MAKTYMPPFKARANMVYTFDLLDAMWVMDIGSKYFLFTTFNALFHSSLKFILIAIITAAQNRTLCVNDSITHSLAASTFRGSLVSTL